MAVQAEQEIVALDAGTGEAKDLVSLATGFQELFERGLGEV